MRDSGRGGRSGQGVAGRTAEEIISQRSSLPTGSTKQHVLLCVNGEDWRRPRGGTTRMQRPWQVRGERWKELSCSVGDENLGVENLRLLGAALGLLWFHGPSPCPAPASPIPQRAPGAASCPQGYVPDPAGSADFSTSSSTFLTHSLNKQTWAVGGATHLKTMGIPAPSPGGAG